MSSDRRIAFRRCLGHISQHLSRQQFEDMKFMCKDVVPLARMEKVHGALDLFQALEERGKLSIDNLEFFTKVLGSIGSSKLLDELVREGFLSQSVVQQQLARVNQAPVPQANRSRERVNEYTLTECLMKIAHGLSSPEVSQLAFTWSEPLLSMSSDKVYSATHLFQLLQQRQIITPGDVRPLYDGLHDIGRSDLAQSINEYLVKTGQERYDVPDGGSRPAGQGGIRDRPGGPNNFQTRRPIQVSEDHGTPNSLDLLQRSANGRERERMSTGESYPHPSMCSEDLELSRIQPGVSGMQPYSGNVYGLTSHSTGSQFTSAQTVGGSTMSMGSYPSGSEQSGLRSGHFPSNGRMQLGPPFLHISGMPSPPPSYDDIAPRSATCDHTPNCHTTPYGLTFDSRSQNGEPLRGPQADQDLMAVLSQKDTELLSKEQELDLLRDQLRQAQTEARQAHSQASQQNEATYVETVKHLEGIIKIKNREVTDLTEEVRKMQTTQAIIPVDDDELYPLDKNPHGVCLIINNHKFYHPTDPEKAHNNRGGAEVDQYNLVQTFRYLRYRVEVEENLTHDEMLDKMMRMSQRDHSNYDSFICCILTHGERDVVHGSDSIEVNLADLTGLMKFSKTLAGKPKMFFVQACRGEKEDAGVKLDYERDSGGLQPSSVASVIPSDADFFYGYATPSGNAAYRSRRHGSWYISELCKVFTESAYESTLSRMMKKVNNQVAMAFTKEGLKQCSENVDRLRKEVHFFHHIRNKVSGRSR